MAEFAFNTEVPLILMHDLDGVVAGDVLRKDFDVSRIGTRPPGWSRVLGDWSWSVLRQSELSRKIGYTHYGERISTESIHVDQYPL
jgi:hypothetical protein